MASVPSCGSERKDVHVLASTPALQQGVAVIRLDGQNLQALRLHPSRGQSRVRVRRAGLGVAGTGHNVAIAALGTRASQVVVVSNPSAAVIGNAAVAGYGRPGFNESILIGEERLGGPISSIVEQQPQQFSSIHVWKVLSD
ncbi:hypothetical protein EYF80_049312 [Liparis tanakae]|uniref:Uncharacterized protein n=1 Tax=Liparis tanakae TaxID=230148 RepID=A0A4Z2FIB2_9TELE|nr:hypothetical protein EYF80_049312 [Liparis tanakae]